MATSCNTTRGVMAGGASSGPTNQINTIEFIEISTTGNAIDFGDLGTARDRAGGAASTTRGLTAGGSAPGASYTNIETFQLASLGNGIDFGDLSVARWTTACMNNITRGVWGAGDPTSNVIDFVDIASAGTATDFGDATVARFNCRGTSNGHAGLAQTS